MENLRSKSVGWRTTTIFDFSRNTIFLSASARTAVKSPFRCPRGHNICVSSRNLITQRDLPTRNAKWTFKLLLTSKRNMAEEKDLTSYERIQWLRERVRSILLFVVTVVLGSREKWSYFWNRRLLIIRRHPLFSFVVYKNNTNNTRAS